MDITKQLSTVRAGLFAGLLGGLVEIGWVTLYADLTGFDPARFARGVITAVGVRALLPGRSSALLSISVNLAFAAALGIVLAFGWRAVRARWPNLSNPLPFGLAALAIIWAINFFIVLPLVRPEFIHVVPYAVSLTSSLLFGATVSAVLYETR